MLLYLQLYTTGLVVCKAVCKAARKAVCKQYTQQYKSKLSQGDGEQEGARNCDDAIGLPIEKVVAAVSFQPAAFATLIVDFAAANGRGVL